MKTLKQKHKILSDLITEPVVKKKLHSFFDRLIKKYSNKTPETTDFKAQVSEIIGHLNKETGLAYRENSQETKSLIRARLNEKFTVEELLTSPP